MKSFDKSKLLNKTNKELEVYIREPEKFEPKAVDCAVQILRERGVEVIAPIQISPTKEVNKKSILSRIEPYEILCVNIVLYLLTCLYLNSFDLISVIGFLIYLIIAVLSYYVLSWFKFILFSISIPLMLIYPMFAFFGLLAHNNPFFFEIVLSLIQVINFLLATWLAFNKKIPN